MKTIEEIRALPQNLRIAGFLKLSAVLNEYAAELRLAKDDSEWTDEESKKWDELADELDGWWWAMSQEEIEFIRPISVRTAIIACGESIIDNPFLKDREQ